MSEEEKNISNHIYNLAKDIENKDRTIQQLKNFYTNISNSCNISDLEKEYLISALEKKIRVNFPKIAKKILGGKSEKAKELLEDVFNKLKDEFDWSKNKVGSRVKVGGDMIAGRQHVCWYISYKNDLGISTGFVYRQLTPTEDPFIEVYLRKVGKEFEKDAEIKKFRVELKEDALDLYKSFLSKTIL